MDYVEAFKNLKTNNKYSRKSPHKAVLLLTVIEMYEQKLLSDNEIKYNSCLINTFVKVWDRTLPNESTFFPEAYIPFWYLQSEDFWHIVPIRGKEDILAQFRDNHTKPSETKIKDNVNYAELDDDLYFLLTLPSGRSTLKRALLETYSALSDKEIDRLSYSGDNSEDKSEQAIEEYKHILDSAKTPARTICSSIDSNYEQQFMQLDDDLQIALNLQYFSFLKKNPTEREMFRAICPSVFDLYGKIAINPVRQNDIDSSFAVTYEAFLADLKISLMSENGAMDLIDSINNAIKSLQEQNEENRVKPEKIFEVAFSNVNPISFCSSRTESKTIIEQVEETENEPLNFYVENSVIRCSIFNKEGLRIFTTDGKFKILHGKLYRFNYKPMCFTVKGMKQNGSIWTKGSKKLVAYNGSDLYPLINEFDFIDHIEDFIEGETYEKNKIRFDGKWYNYEGDHLFDAEEDLNSDLIKGQDETLKEESFDFRPKGKFKKMDEIINSPYDYLWLLAIIDLVYDDTTDLSMNFDELACMMIANAWTILNDNPELKCKQTALVECINYLIEESKEEMEEALEWYSSKDQIFDSIRDFPMAGSFEDIVDELVEQSPFNVLKAWIPFSNKEDFIFDSINFNHSCLYALHIRKIDSYIEVNPNWKHYLCAEHDNISKYFELKYVDCLKGNCRFDDQLTKYT